MLNKSKIVIFALILFTTFSTSVFAEQAPVTISNITDWADTNLNLVGAHELTKASPSVIVAVITTGVDFKHPYLQNKL